MTQDKQMKENYTPGRDCQCHAHSEEECGCDADWTPREVYELREQRDKALCELEMWRDGNIMHESHRNEIQGLEQQRDRLAEAMRAMWPFIEEDPPCGGKSEIQQYLQALAAVKGGSDE
jgi:hypothetical protein